MPVEFFTMLVLYQLSYIGEPKAGLEPATASWLVGTVGWVDESEKEGIAASEGSCRGSFFQCRCSVRAELSGRTQNRI